MAGLFGRLFGGRSRPPDPDPLPGVSGYRMPTGRTGEGGFRGSTSPTRTFKGSNPRNVGVRADTNTGWEGGLGSTQDVRQASYRGEVPGATSRNPRLTSRVVTPQTRIGQNMQNASPAEFYGGPMLKTGPGNNTAGGSPLAPAARAGGHSKMDTTTPKVRRQPVIGAGIPGGTNVRNNFAQRFKNKPGEMHTYKSAPRADQAKPNRAGQATDGNVHADDAVTQVTVPNRFVYPGGGNTTWTVQRQMPYNGRGDGARGADLNGQRYYAEFHGGQQQFMNAGQGDYGIARARGGDHKRPVSFQEPAPWTANFYDTTEDLGYQDTPNSPSHAPNMVYVSPSTGRASNNTGRMG